MLRDKVARAIYIQKSSEESWNNIIPEIKKFWLDYADEIIKSELDKLTVLDGDVVCEGTCHNEDDGCDDCVKNTPAYKQLHHTKKQLLDLT